MRLDLDSYGPVDIDAWMALRNTGRIGGPHKWAGEPPPRQGDQRGEMRRRLRADDDQTWRRIRERTRRELLPDPTDLAPLDDPNDRRLRWRGPLELLLKLHEFLKIIAEENDIGRRTCRQSYLYAPDGWYNPYDDLPTDCDGVPRRR